MGNIKGFYRNRLLLIEHAKGKHNQKSHGGAFTAAAFAKAGAPLVNQKKTGGGGSTSGGSAKTSKPRTTSKSSKRLEKKPTPKPQATQFKGRVTVSKFSVNKNTGFTSLDIRQASHHLDSGGTVGMKTSRGLASVTKRSGNYDVDVNRKRSGSYGNARSALSDAWVGASGGKSYADVEVSLEI